jgi:hypothetical protein
MAGDHTAAIVLSSILFGVFLVVWVLAVYFCKCRKPKTQELHPNITRRSYSPGTEEREAMIRRSLREKTKRESKSVDV